MLVSCTNSKLSSLRDKNRAFNRWKETVTRREMYSIKVKLAHFNQEVETIKLQESLLRTKFNS